MEELELYAIKKLIEQAEHYDWSLQGLGMFRLYLSRKLRLHVWDPRFAVEHVSTLHTHPWDFKSRVLVGSLINRKFELEVSGYPNFMTQMIVCGPGGCAMGDVTSVRLKLCDAVRVGAGGTYEQFVHEIHESRPEPGTITVIERHFHEDTEHANVYWPHGEQWVSAEPRNATTEEVKAMKLVALERLEMHL